MILPNLTDLSGQREMISDFRGYNHNLMLGDSEFYDMKNMTSDHYPVLSPREKRYTVSENIGIAGHGASAGSVEAGSFAGIGAKEALYWVADGMFYYNGLSRGSLGNVYATNGQSVIDRNTPRRLISMGAYVLIFPDNLCYDTTKPEKGLQPLGHKLELDFSLPSDSNGVRYTLCRPDGLPYNNAEIIISEKPPEAKKPAEGGEEGGEPDTPSTEITELKNGQLWMDVSQDPNVLKQYSQSAKAWIPISTTYIMLEHSKINPPDPESADGTGYIENFKPYDGITITGSRFKELNTDTIIQKAGKGYIVIPGIIPEQVVQDGTHDIEVRPETPDEETAQGGSADTPLTPYTKIIKESGTMTIERKVPSMDFVTISENRVWGCNSEKREIYSSKLGDPFNWNCYEGISTDSFAATVASGGPFTGACSYLGNVLFFKEDVIHKVMGSKPSNYQVTNSVARGVEKGSENSLVTVNETLFYKSRSGFCAYDGGLPVEISQPLGGERYKNAVAGSVSNKYYVSMEGGNGSSLFVYDTARNTWHKEDGLKVSGFAALDGRLYYVAKSNVTDYGLYCTTKSPKHSYCNVDANANPEYIAEGAISWMAETGEIGDISPDKKYITKLQLRGTMEAGATLKVSLQYDSGAWVEKPVLFAGDSKRTFTLPILPIRCDHMKIRLEGTGDTKIYSITKTLELGSEL